MPQSSEGASTAELLARATPLHRLQLRCKGGFPGPDEVGVKNVEAQAHRAINDDCLLGVFANPGIRRDDEHLSLRLWCPTSKPVFDLPGAMNTSTRFGDEIISQIRRSKFLIADFTGRRGGVYFEAGLAMGL